MRRLVVYALVLIAVAIIVHHWVTHGSPVDSNNLFSHEFVLSVVLGALIGGLLL